MLGSSVSWTPSLPIQLTKCPCDFFQSKNTQNVRTKVPLIGILRILSFGPACHIQNSPPLHKASELVSHITSNVGIPQSANHNTDSEKMQVFWLNFNLA